jgi:MarR family transcriptional regulator, lower aerobic nicotinate degradation pathway regulator
MHDGREFTIWLRKAYLAFHRRVNAWLSEYGITADQFVVLRSIVIRPGGTQIEIAGRVASDPNTVTAILKSLEEKGLVRRESHPQDRRARCVFPTAAGLSLERRGRKATDPLLDILGDCSIEHDQSLRFLQRVHEVFSVPQSGTNGQVPRRPSTKKAVL